MIGTGIANYFGWRLRYFRLSSHAKGSICPPLTFCIMEDITAADGKGGKTYREAAMARYNASPMFRILLVQFLWAQYCLYSYTLSRKRWHTASGGASQHYTVQSALG